MSHPIDILIIAIEPGRSGPPRLPQNLAKMGLGVATLCPADNPLAHTDYADRHFTLPASRHWRRLRHSIEQALAETGAQIVIPADEQVVALLHYLVQGGRMRDAGQRQVLVASLGDPQHHADALFKSRTLAVARALALPVPEGRVLPTVGEAQAYAASLGYPVIAKKSFSWAGQGVIRCDGPEALARALAPQRWPRLRALARTLLGRDWYPVDDTWEIQQQIAGQPAMYCGLAWKGRLIGGFSGIPTQLSSEFGPSISVRLVHDQAIEDICRAMVSRMAMSGFVGFDFILRESDGAPLLIECNPRPIQVCHLGYRIGADLSSALADLLRGGPGGRGADAARAAPIRAERSLDVALFPGCVGSEVEVATPSVLVDVPGADSRLMAFWQALPGMPQPI